MNKSELINELSEETTFSKMDVTRVLDSLTRVVSRALKKGEKVSITGFGSFWISRRPARKALAAGRPRARRIRRSAACQD